MCDSSANKKGKFNNNKNEESQDAEILTKKNDTQ